MRSAAPQRRRAFIERIDLPRLRGIGRRRQREVSIAARLGENLELIVYAAVASTSRVGERPVSVYERIARRPDTIETRKATVGGEAISEFEERPSRALRIVRIREAVV